MKFLFLLLLPLMLINVALEIAMFFVRVVIGIIGAIIEGALWVLILAYTAFASLFTLGQK